jgi:hypothetical protein
VSEPTITIPTRHGPQVVYRLAKGRYLSGCRRFLIEDRDLDGDTELYEHRGYKHRRVSLRRRAKGWAVYDLEHGSVGYDPENSQRVVRIPLKVWLGGYPETLSQALETLEGARALVARQLEHGSARAVESVQPGEERVDVIEPAHA